MFHHYRFGESPCRRLHRFVFNSVVTCVATNWTRRRLLQSGAALATVSATGWTQRLFGAALELGEPRHFDFDWLISRAETLLRQPWDKPASPHDALLDMIDYDAQRKINPRADQALWVDSDSPFAVEFFHLSRTARVPVAINVVDDGSARRVQFDPDLFTYGDLELARKLPDDLGFAGFRVMVPGFRDMDPDTAETDWLAFLGASYFRSSGELGQYGISARGVAVNTGLDAPEPFPRFSAFWLERPEPGSHTITIYALLEGEHITGAYRFDCSRDGRVIMDVKARLFQRTNIERLGIAPLTSMYWYSQIDHRQGVDWRPEVHDSDGLAIVGNDGERLWRPLTNPVDPQFNSFERTSPKGFGLLQRDRDFDHYQDWRVRYGRRPSLWVEPRGDWGKGRISLMELPTNAEIYDNVVAFWTPDEPATADQQWAFDYRLYWVDEAPFPDDLAWVATTRTGRAGEPGTYDKLPPHYRKFVIDYSGGRLNELAAQEQPRVVASAARGEIVNPYIVQVAGTPYWRAFFDWHGEPDGDPVDLCCRLTLDGEDISETWRYSYLPHDLPPNAPRL